MSEPLKRAAKSISINVEVLNQDTPAGRWNPLAGQFLVYGLERSIGFGASVELEALVERAFKRGEPIEPVIYDFLLALKKETED